MWGYITLQDLETPNYNGPRLHRDRHDVGTTLSRSLGMLFSCLLRVGFNQIVLSDKVFPVRVHVLLVDCSDVIFKKPPGEIICGSRRPIFKLFADVTSTRVCNCDQEVRSGLTVGRFKSEVDEVLASEIRRTEIDHATFVDEADFIEELTHVLRGLIGSKGSSDASDIRCCAESSGKLQGR